MSNRSQHAMNADHARPSWATAGPAHLTKPLSKLCHVPRTNWAALKVRSITTCDRLLAALGRYEDRDAFARHTQISMDELTTLVRRADLARVRGLGWVFRSMLEALDVADIAALAVQDSGKLRERLHIHNKEYSIARRSPTMTEVTDWISQARGLTSVVTYLPERQKLTGTN